MTGTAHLPTSDQPRPCSQRGGPEHSLCERRAGHDGPCYAWLPGYGPVTWPHKETPHG